MDDIKAMIRNFKNSRAGQKENMTANHYEDSQEYKYKWCWFTIKDKTLNIY